MTKQRYWRFHAYVPLLDKHFVRAIDVVLAKQLAGGPATIFNVEAQMMRAHLNVDWSLIVWECELVSW